MDENDLEALRARVKRAQELLREWREKYEDRERHVHRWFDRAVSLSATDLARDTDTFLRGR